MDAPLAGFQLDLLKDGQTALTKTTDNDGAYDFDDVPPGKYKIHLSRGFGFCAPSVKCTTDGCKINPVLKVGPQTTVVTYVFVPQNAAKPSAAETDLTCQALQHLLKARPEVRH